MSLRSLGSGASALFYDDFGDPLTVIEQRELPIPQPKDGEVLIKMIMAPINPADINTIQGVGESA